MEQIAVAPPPLPPKTRRSPPDTSATVLAASPAHTTMFECRFPEVQRGHSQSHVVKIRINPQESEVNRRERASVICDVAPCIRISVNSPDAETVQQNNNTMADTATERSSNHYFYYGPFNCNNVMSSGQVSPSDTLDSGTCSDLDGTPPPLPKKKNPSVSVTVIGGQHKRVSSLTSSGAEVDSDDNDDDDDNESSISCDSLNSRDVQNDTTIIQEATIIPNERQTKKINCSMLPQGLLKDIRDHRSNTKTTPNENTSIVEITPKTSLVNESTYEERKERDKEEASLSSLIYDTDRFYKFHLNENENDEIEEPVKVVEDGTFAGYKDLLSDSSSTIRSAKGTVRGVKNRVRAGIATFLQINSSIRSYKEKDAGKVVVYTTTMGILRETYNACMKVKQILRTLLIKFEERDVFMSSEYQAEIRDRMRCDHILVPQVFVDGQHVGDAETIERLNESGELRKILKPYKSMDACTPCKVCGGYRLLPCPVCKGSKKSVHRNHFTTEFVALKCMNCDEVGLVKCSSC